MIFVLLFSFYVYLKKINGSAFLTVCAGPQFLNIGVNGHTNFKPRFGVWYQFTFNAYSTRLAHKSIVT